MVVLFAPEPQNSRAAECVMDSWIECRGECSLQQNGQKSRGKLVGMFVDLLVESDQSGNHNQLNCHKPLIVRTEAT
jgi:hypothetical protein